MYCYFDYISGVHIIFKAINKHKLYFCKLPIRCCASNINGSCIYMDGKRYKTNFFKRMVEKKR